MFTYIRENVGIGGRKEGRKHICNQRWGFVNAMLGDFDSCQGELGLLKSMTINV